MPIVADFHIHSKYSRAVSQKMELPEIARWCTVKGIDLVGTGDWTHPIWFKNIQTVLKEVTPGLYILKNQKLPGNNVRFMLTTEISSIYSQDGQTRRIHNLVISPSISTAQKVIDALKKRGANLLADGRPIIGLSSITLLEMLMEIDENIVLIPCHVWTPWFSLYGSKSGFDSIEACYGKTNSKYIYSVETGLSSDPIMNWQIKDLATRSIVSSSDAHSGAKLGREATVFVPTQDKPIPITSIAYADIVDAFKQKPEGKLKIGYTIEFFPEEGKYHWTGHRDCNIRYRPAEVKTKGVICPVCKKPLTVGVENRVIDLAEKILTPKDLLYIKNSHDLTFVYDKAKKRRPFVSLVPLIEVLTEINNGSPTKGLREYDRITSEFATEFDILLRQPYAEIERAGGEKLRQAIEIIRNRRVFVDPGYDGVFGRVKIFNENDKKHEPAPLF